MLSGPCIREVACAPTTAPGEKWEGPRLGHTWWGLHQGKGEGEEDREERKEAGAEW